MQRCIGAIADVQPLRSMPSTALCITFKGLTNIMRQHYAKIPLRGNQPFRAFQQGVVGERFSITRVVTSLVPAGDSRLKIWRVADDQVVLADMVLGIMMNVLRMHLDTLRPRRFLHVVTRLRGGSLVQLHGVNQHGLG